MSLAQAGAEVVLVDSSQEKANDRLARIQAAGGKGYFIAADITNPVGLQELLTTVIERSGQCDILINGAGVNSTTPFLEITEEEYESVFAVNTRAVFLACQVFVKYFLDNGLAASIINIGSMSAVIPLSQVFTYSMSKAAVHNISRNLAREWAMQNIRVNTLVPGFFPAQQNRKILSPDRVKKIMDHTPMNRFGKAEELSGATLLLASDAGSFITGEEIAVDGGFAAMTI